MINNILLTHDGSDSARRAPDIAAEHCVKCDATLSVVHALMHGRPAEELVRMAHAGHMVKEAHKAVSPRVIFATSRSYDLFSVSNDAAGTMRVISWVGDQLVAYAKSHAEELGMQTVHIIFRAWNSEPQVDAATCIGTLQAGVSLSARAIGTNTRRVSKSIIPRRLGLLIRRRNRNFSKPDGVV